DASRTRLDDDGLPIMRLVAIRDPCLGEDGALGTVVSLGAALAGHVGPVAEAGDLAVREVGRVVDVTHPVRVREPDLDDDLVRERAWEVAGVSGCRRMGRVRRHRPSVRSGAGRIREGAASWRRPTPTTAPS